MPTRVKKTAPTPRRGRPSDHGAMRAQILAGAADAFARKGYAPTTVEDILRAAGVSRQTFYRFFKNKDEACGA
ncbi:MAG: helix-turn-helix transcriptional regulator, partial [Myxococcales bacterium]|nr:helix-turn-helix transcriptional regulator [Myxococcales bacterium]